MMHKYSEFIRNGHGVEGQGNKRGCTPCMLSLVFGLIVTLTGCSTVDTEVEHPQVQRRMSELPRIHSIGNANILVFEDQQQLVVPIKGAYFADETLIWSITAMGVSPLLEGVDFLISHPDGFSSGNEKDDEVSLGDERSNIIHLTLTESYVARLKTGDTLSIEVSIADGTEHLALERLHRNDEKIRTMLEELTGELNKEESDEQTVGKLVSCLVSTMQESNNYIGKLRPTDLSLQYLGVFEEDVDVIRDFMVRRKPIPTNLHDEVKMTIRPEEDKKSRRSEKDQEGEEAEAQPGPAVEYIESAAELDSWGGLERRLQIIAARQRSMVSSRESQTVRAPQLSTATRQFVLYEVEDYRNQVLSSRVPVHDISAYPLPGSETEKLFGKGVASMYFVVRLSLRNTTEEDQLISTGLVKAYGRALVSSVDNTADGEEEDVQFTVPVQIVPQSREHVYTIVAEGRFNSPRNIVFRGLELSGSLATALVGAFDPTISSLQWVSLYTGIIIPAADKAWPDKVPRHLSNIVNFSMPDLIKVPRNGVVGHKYLFFSKGDLQAIISDTKYAKSAINGEGPVVVYMAFDSLHIPFENTRKPGGQLVELDRANNQIDALTERLSNERKAEALEAKQRELSLGRIDELLAESDELKDQLDAVLTTWCRMPESRSYPGWGLAPDYFREGLNTVNGKLRSTNYIGSGLSDFDEQLPVIRQLLGEWQKVFDTLEPYQVNTSVSERISRLENREEALTNNRNQLSAGLVSELDERLVENLDREIKQAAKAFDVYAFAAKQIAALSLSDQLDELTDANTTNLYDELDVLLTPLRRLSDFNDDCDLFSTLRVPAVNE